MLVRTFTDELVEGVIDETDTREVRFRLMPARLTLLFVLACWLFMRSGYGQVLGKLADALVAAGVDWRSWRVPTAAAIGKARERLGPAPVRLLFDRVKGVTGTPDMPGVFWRGLRVTAMDGFTLDLADTEDNSGFYGRGANGSGTDNPYPQLRGVVLTEVGTRGLIEQAHGPHRVGEQSLAVDVVAALKLGMICLADRNFASYTLWRQAAATGAQLLWRLSASFRLPVLEVLPDGTYISELRPARKKDGPPIRIRVIEYTVWTKTVTNDDDDHAEEEAKEEATAEEMSELFCLATTMLDPHTAPAAELADLYPKRWPGAETTIGEMKTIERGGPEVVLRSRSPDLVEQEYWAMLCVYQAIRDLITQAAPPGLPPTRISFKHAAEAASDWAARAALSPQASSGQS